MAKLCSNSIVFPSHFLWESILLLVLLNLRNANSSELSYTEQNCLDAHNQYRAKHGVAPLSWNRTLAGAALKWAKHLLNRGKLEHDTRALRRDHQGENLGIYVTYPAARPLCRNTDERVKNCVNCLDMVKLWYDEIKCYDFAAGKGNGKGAVLHFTQVVWKESTQLGVAAGSGERKLIFVARYYVGGNFGSPENFKRNVPPPVALSTETGRSYPPVGWLVLAAALLTVLLYLLSLIILRIRKETGTNRKCC